jgi:hypothetical protein
MTADRANSARDEELRELARTLIGELVTTLQNASAESAARGRQIIEEIVVAPARRESAEEVWARLNTDPAVFLQGTYGLLSTALGGRARPPGTAVVTPLEVKLFPHRAGRGQVIGVSGPALANSLGLASRFESDDGKVTRSIVRQLRRHDGQVELEPEQDDLDDAEAPEDWRRWGHPASRVRHAPRLLVSGVLSVLSFNATAVTGAAPPIHVSAIAANPNLANPNPANPVSVNE